LRVLPSLLSEAWSPTLVSLTSARAFMFISVHFDFHTGDLNPFRTAPMLGTHKPALGNPLPAPS
jgi:hypothetical protein